MKTNIMSHHSIRSRLQAEMLDYEMRTRKMSPRPRGRRALCLSKRGFTLVEVIIVLVILAILAAFAIPSLTGYIEKSQQAAVIAECRQAVEAAQTLASEEYSEGTEPLYPDIRKLAEVNGFITNYELSGKNVVTHLTYVNKYSVVYCRDFNNCAQHDESYTIGGGVTQWVQGTSYKIGDMIEINGVYFRCIRSHTSGTTSRTRNPALRSNKSTWRVIGYAPGSNMAYSSTCGYEVGVSVIYKGHTYVRKDFNLVGGQVPYEGKSSDYWTFIS